MISIFLRTMRVRWWSRRYPSTWSMWLINTLSINQGADVEDSVRSCLLVVLLLECNHGQITDLIIFNEFGHYLPQSGTLLDNGSLPSDGPFDQGLPHVSWIYLHVSAQTVGQATLVTILASNRYGNFCSTFVSSLFIYRGLVHTTCKQRFSYYE